jgi:hypothetical protein
MPVGRDLRLVRRARWVGEAAQRRRELGELGDQATRAQRIKAVTAEPLANIDDPSVDAPERSEMRNQPSPEIFAGLDLELEVRIGGGKRQEHARERPRGLADLLAAAHVRPFRRAPLALVLALPDGVGHTAAHQRACRPQTRHVAQHRPPFGLPLPSTFALATARSSKAPWTIFVHPASRPLPGAFPGALSGRGSAFLRAGAYVVDEPRTAAASAPTRSRTHNLVDYVVAHELCHMLHEGHGRKFWAGRGQVMPDSEVWRKSDRAGRAAPQLRPFLLLTRRTWAVGGSSADSGHVRSATWPERGRECPASLKMGMR